MRNFSLAMKTNSAYARLPLNGAQLPELAVLDALVAARRRSPLNLRPRLVPKAVPVLIPGASAPPPASLDAATVAQWLRS